MAKAYTPGNSHIIPYDQCSGRANAADFQIPEMKEHNVIGKKLLDARKNAKMSRIDTIASLEKYGTTVAISTISRWERGIVSPSVPQFLALCDIYHIDDIAEYFIGTPIEPAEVSPELNEKGLDILQTVKEALIASGQFVPASHSNTTSFAEATEMRSMPVSDNLASAGTGSWLDDDQFTLINVPVNQIPAGAEGSQATAWSQYIPITRSYGYRSARSCAPVRLASSYAMKTAILNSIMRKCQTRMNMMITSVMVFFVQRFHLYPLMKSTRQRLFLRTAGLRLWAGF